MIGLINCRWYERKEGERTPMPHLILAALLALGLAAPAAAEPRQPSPAQAAQQQRMRDCNARAKEQTLRGDARSTFMRQCLSRRGTPAAAAPAAGS